MVSISFILILALFSLVIVIAFVFLIIFWFKIIIQLKQKNDIKSATKAINLIKPIYERMGEDAEATEQYIYMRRKLMGG